MPSASAGAAMVSADGTQKIVSIRRFASVAISRRGNMKSPREIRNRQPARRMAQ